MTRAVCGALIVLIWGIGCADEAPHREEPLLSLPDAAVDDANNAVEDDADATQTGSDTAPSPDATAIADSDIEPDVPAPPQWGPMDQGAIGDVVAYQSIEVPVRIAGAPADSDVPIIAGRKTLLRIGLDAVPATGRLSLALTGDVSWTRSIDVTPAAAGGSVDVVVPGATLTAGTQLELALETLGAEGGAGSNTLSVDLNVQDDGPLPLVIVPFVYQGRTPDTSEAQLELFRELVSALYPATEVTVTVHAPVEWTGFFDLGSLNRTMVQMREDEDAPRNSYYYAVIQPDDSFADYCSGTCTTGQSYTVSNAEAWTYRAGSGMGWSGERWAWTLAHELGHMHGRGHAPCGVAFWRQDGNYPYSTGEIGVTGWDARSETLMSGPEWTDLMGYCDDLWISDYTYLGIHERLREVNVYAGVRDARRRSRQPSSYRVVELSRGRAKDVGVLHLRSSFSGRFAEVIGCDGHLLGTADAVQNGYHSVDVMLPMEMTDVCELRFDGARYALAP